jgi:predicted DNA-binding protein
MTIAFRPSDEQEKAIDELMKNKEITQTDAVKYIIDEWMHGKNRYAFLENACPALAFGDEHFKCVWGRDSKTPDIKNLAKIEEDTENICKSCKRTHNIIEENKQMKEQLRKGVIIDVPACMRGGRISDDGKELYCDMILAFRKVEECKKLRNGANCQHLRWSRIQLKGSLPDSDNR